MMPSLPTLSDHSDAGGLRLLARAAVLTPIALLPACTSLGSLMSPYSEKFSCKNSDHGQCIHPDKAYEDAVAGRRSRSDPAVTNDRGLLRAHRGTSGGDGRAQAGVTAGRGRKGSASAFPGYRDSVYHELQGLLEDPVTPMLAAPRTVRTLILPYADRQRPDRLYMPRYVYSILKPPGWVVGDYLVEPVSRAEQAPLLGQVHEGSAAEQGPAGNNGPQAEARP